MEPKRTIEPSGSSLLRQRHFPRLCGSCRAPMASQEGTCWCCGTEWAPEAEPRTTLRLIAGGARPTASEPSVDANRWTNEGGSFASAVALPSGAAR
jgi:hypothetical protein